METTVFNFKENWNLVEKHLDDEKVLSALDDGMNEYLRQHPDVKKNYGDWSRGEKVWLYVNSDYWCRKSLERVEEKFPDWNEQWLKDKNIAIQNWDWIFYPKEFLDELEESGLSIELMQMLEKSFWEEANRLEALVEPQSNTYEFYQAFGLCHWLAPFCRELGRKIYPSLNWKAVRGDEHSTSVGFDEAGNPVMVFDILHFDDTDFVMKILNSSKNSKDNDYLLCALSRVVECIQVILGDERTKSAEFPDMEKVREAVPMFIGVAVPSEEIKFNEENILEYHSEELNKIWEEYEKGEMKTNGAAFLYLLIKSLDWLEEHGEEFFDNIE